MRFPGSRAQVSRLRPRLAGTLAIFCACLIPTLEAQTPKPTEYEVQAAYLSNFGRFVEWPPRSGQNDNTFYICVLGQDPFGPLLDAALKGESIDGAPLAPRRVSNAAEAAGCRIIFVNPAREKDAELKAILAALRATSALTVSDHFDFTREGGMIQFVLDGNRVRFEINLEAAQRAGLTLSSQLLKLAVTIRRTP